MKNILKKYKTILFLLLASILIELFLFNYDSIKVIFASNKNIYPEFSITDSDLISSERISVPYENEDFKLYSSGIVLKNIKDINCNIYSISFETENNEEVNTTVYIKREFFDNVNNDNENETVCKKTIRLGNKNSFINTFIDYNDTSNIYVNLYMYGKELNVKNVVLNKFYFEFNILRVIIVFCILLLIYGIKSKKIYSLMYIPSNKRQITIYRSVCLLTIIIIVLFCILEHMSSPNVIKIDPSKTEESMILQAEALRNGSICLLNDASEVNKIENPYDISSRIYNNINYKFDTTYYNGKYYQYFSILPVIFLILPFRLITGFYVSTKIFNTFLFAILLLLISILYRKLVNIFIKNTTFFHFILGYITIIFGSNVIAYVRGLVYDIPVVFGMCSLFSTVILLLDIIQNNKRQKIKLVLSGIFTGFIVMSKPSLLRILCTYFLYAIHLLYKKQKI